MSAVAHPYVRPYNPSDVKSLSKKQLLALVALQPGQWPCKGRSKGVNPSTVTKQELREALLDPKNKFSTTAQLPSPPPLQSIAHPPDPFAMAQTPNYTSQIPPGANVPSGSCKRPERRPLRLYIEDNRPMKMPTKTTVSVVVPDVGSVPSWPGAWLTPVQDVIEELQGSHGAIRGGGPVKLGIPDDRDQDFTQYFTHGYISKLVEMPAVPDKLIVPPGFPSRLIIRVEFSSNSTKRPPDDHLYPEVITNDSLIPHASYIPLEMARERNRKRARPSIQKQNTINWLKKVAAERPGYEKFCHSQNRVLQNPDIVRVWEFAAQFTNAYHKQRREGEGSGTKISKAAIRAALNVGETWLAQAEEAFALIKIYGDGGTHPAHEVIEEVSMQRNPPLGRGRLIEFLHRWKLAHPISP